MKRILSGLVLLLVSCAGPKAATLPSVAQPSLQAPQAQAIQPALKPWPAAWTTFHYSNTHTGLSSVATPYAPQAVRPVWRFHTKGPIGASAAVGKGGLIYVGSSDGNLYCLNFNGTLRWKAQTGGPLTGAVTIANDGSLLYVAGLKKLYAITSQGRVRWSFTAGLAILGTPTLNANGSVLYVPSFDHRLYALDARTGAKRWAFTTGDGIDASPTVGPNGTIYIGSYDANFYAINPSGTLLWKYNTGFLVETTAVIDKGGNVVFANDLGIVFAFKTTGSLIGVVAFPAPIYSSVTIGPDVKLTTPLGKLVLYHSFYVADWGGNVYGYGYEDAPLSTGSPLLLAIQAWKFDSPLSFFSSPAVSANNHVYLGGADGNFYEFDGPTGRVLEQFPLGTATSASPAIGYDGSVYLGAGNDLYAFH